MKPLDILFNAEQVTVQGWDLFIKDGTIYGDIEQPKNKKRDLDHPKPIRITRT